MTDTLYEQIQLLYTTLDKHEKELRKQLMYLAGRVKELSKLQLPKCWQLDEDNNLIQNKVITIEMRVYFLSPNKQSHIILEDTVYTINISKDGMYIYLEQYTNKKPQELYSTREAAQKAIEKILNEQ